MPKVESRTLTDTGIVTTRRWARELVGAASMRGDFLAGRLPEIIMQMTAGQRTAHGREPPPCACCRGPLKAPDFTVVVVTPERRPGAARLAVGICPSCAPDRAQAQHRVKPALVRLLTMMSVPGDRRVRASGAT